jgi:hypothetical protein
MLSASQRSLLSPPPPYPHSLLTLQILLFRPQSPACFRCMTHSTSVNRTYYSSWHLFVELVRNAHKPVYTLPNTNRKADRHRQSQIKTDTDTQLYISVETVSVSVSVSVSFSLLGIHVRLCVCHGVCM